MPIPIKFLKDEETYFLEQEAEKRRQMRENLESQARAAKAKGEIAAALGAGDEALLERIYDLGFDGDSVKVLHLLPLVEVAWADDEVSAAERVTIMRAAEAHGIGPGTESGAFLASVLETRPDPALLEAVHEILGAVLRASGSSAADLLALCTDVAEASGGFLGLGNKICDEEAEIISDFASRLSPSTENSVKALVGDD